MQIASIKDEKTAEKVEKPDSEIKTLKPEGAEEV